jgi:hypothetical protein
MFLPTTVGHPFAHVTTAPILSEELGGDVTALALTPRALNPQHVQLASDIAEGEICSSPWLYTYSFGRLASRQGRRIQQCGRYSHTLMRRGEACPIISAAHLPPPASASRLCASERAPRPNQAGDFALAPSH